MNKVSSSSVYYRGHHGKWKHDLLHLKHAEGNAAKQTRNGRDLLSECNTSVSEKETITFAVLQSRTLKYFDHLSSLTVHLNLLWPIAQTEIVHQNQT
jgi:hypothetical protein